MSQSPGLSVMPVGQWTSIRQTAYFRQVSQYGDGSRLFGAVLSVTKEKQEKGLES